MSAKIIPLKSEKSSTWEDVTGIPYLKRNRVSGVYFVRKFKAGKGSLFKTTGERTKAAARTVADELIAAWLSGTRQVQGRRKTMKQVIAELDEHLKTEFDRGTRRLKTRMKDKDYLPLIERLWGDRFLDEMNEDIWAEWVQYDAPRLKRETLFDIAKYLSKVLTYAYERRYIARKPKIKNPDAPKKTGRNYTDEEIAYLIRSADPRTLSQIVLGYQCGLRSYEVRCLEKAWIKFESETVATLTLPETFVKANARAIQLSGLAAWYLQTLFALDDSGSPYVYPAPESPMKRCETAVYQNRRWRKVVEKANEAMREDGKRPMTGRTWFRYLRQSFYNKVLLDLGLPVQQVSAYGGTSIKTLQKHYLLPDPKRTAAVGQAIQIPSIEGDR